MYCIIRTWYARAHTRVYVTGTVPAACCMLHTAMQLCVADDGRKLHAAAVARLAAACYTHKYDLLFVVVPNQREIVTKCDKKQVKCSRIVVLATNLENRKFP